MPTIPIEERVAIQELAQLYVLYCDTHQFTKVADLFAEECYYDETVVGGPPASSSRVAIDEMFREHGGILGPVMHICTNHIISAFSGNAASGVVHVHAEGIFHISGKLEPFRIFGCYDDRYEKKDDRWYFKSRVLRLLAPSQGAAPTVGGITYNISAEHFAIR